MTDFNPYGGNSGGGMSFADALKMSKGTPANSSSSFSVPSGFYDYKPGGMSFGDAVKAGEDYDFGDNKGFLDQFLNKKTNRQTQDEKTTKSEENREQAKALAKTWQSGSLGENLNFLAQSGGNEQPMVIGGGQAQPQSGGITGAIKGGLSAGAATGFNPITTGIGAVMGFLG
tara:strand:- start:2257 stop:2772 length:516 start_codon:yes stop_codon:yes gene_type:complete